MQITIEISKEDEDFLLSNEHYHQRFDGCPYLLTFVAIAETKQEPRKNNCHAESRFGFFFDHKCDWYLLEKDNKKVTQLFLHQAKSNPNFTKELRKKWETDEKEMYELLNKIKTIDFSEFSNEELKNFHKTYVKKFVNAFTYSSLIDGFALGSDKLIAKMIQEHLSRIGKVQEYNKFFEILTAPVHLSFENKAEISLMESIKGLKSLEQHQEDYFWIHNNYVDDIVLDLEFFSKETEQRKKQENLDEKLEHLKTHPEKNKRIKEQLVQELELPEKIRNLLVYSEDFTKWQDDRKKLTFLNAYYSFKILKEIEKRFSFSLEDLKMLTPFEIDLVFENKISKEEIEKRKKAIMFYWKEKEFRSITGEKAKEFHEEFAKSEIPENLNEILGLCASIGKVQGKVKIIKSAKEIGKLEQGEILVAVMTRPDYIVGMRKAKAIITNEGGLTCHAAIVSRELKIPCIIGTKIATNVLKDGDFVEVDANNGIVKIPKKS